MNKQPPSDTYCGIVLVLDKPSRFDLKSGHLLSGIARDWFHDFTAVEPNACEIRLVSDRSAFPPSTRYVILSGADSIRQWTNDRQTIQHHCYDSFVHHKGEVYPAALVHNIQDCLDFTSEDGDAPEDESGVVNDKDTSDTRRGNYPFWTKWAIKKLLGETPKCTAKDFRPILQPSLQTAIDALTVKGQTLYLDIECSRAYGTLDCIGYRVNDGPVYVVPVYTYQGKKSYGNIHLFLHALSLAMQHNLVVGHNISGFDLPYLAINYRIAPGRQLYDTMLANHRLFAEPEKSLGHVIAQWTGHEYHKDQIIVPHSREDEQRLWMYNARDVHRLADIMQAQSVYARLHNSMPAIGQVNRCIYPYLKMTLRGLRVDDTLLAQRVKDLQKRVAVYHRIGCYLVGKEFNMASSMQCVKFFHEELGYEAVATSEKTGKPSLGKKAMYQLAVKYNNPIIPLILAYRKAAKDLSMLSYNELIIRK